MAALTNHGWRQLAGVWAVLIAAGATLPSQYLHHVPSWFDKVVHLCEYALLSWLLGNAARTGGASLPSTVGWSSLTSILYGAALELVQLMLPYRQGDWRDLGMNTLGTALGMSAGWLHWRRRA